MNGKDIFIALNHIDTKYIEAAQPPQTSSRHIAWKRPAMIAAIIALMLMLAGCAAAVYLLRTQDMAVGTEAGERPIIVDEKHTYVGMTEAPYQIISVNGLKGTSAYEASKEWYDFKQAYDPDHHIATVTDPWPEYPAEYDAYNLYSDEMKDAVDKIAKKYHLTLAGAYQHFTFDAENVYEFMGKDYLLHPGSGVSMVPFCREFGSTDNKGDMFYYASGNFQANFWMATDDNAWPHDPLTVVWYLRKDVFDPCFLDLDESIEWKEWVYTTQSGNEVLMLHSDDFWAAFMLCDREDAMIVVRIEGVAEGWSDDAEGNVWAERDIMSQAQMEKFADAINFDIQPNIDPAFADDPPK